MATSEAPTALAERFEHAFQSSCAARNWGAAVDARVNCAVWAFQNGRRDQSEEFLDEAIALALAHGLPTRALELEINRLDQKMIGDPAGETLDELKRELPRLVSAMVKLLMAASRRALAAEDTETASELLSQAAVFAQVLSPQNRSSVELELADFHDSQASAAADRKDCQRAEAEYTKALSHAEQALRSARIGGAVDMLAAPLLKVAVLRAQFPDDAHQKRSDEAIAELERGGWTGDFLNALILRSQSRVRAGQLEGARADIDRALAAAPNNQLRRMAVKTAALIRHQLKDWAGATSAVSEAIRLLEQEEAPTRAADETALRQRYKEIEGLYLFASWLAAEGNDGLQAFHFAENGRAVSLVHELALAGTNSNPSPASTFEQAHSMLVEDSAALLTLSVTRWGTLAVLLDHQHAAPRIFFLDLSGSDLKTMLTPKSGADEKAWTQVLLNAVPEFSAKLLPKLEPALRELAPTCQALYVAPDSFLYNVPFSALTFSDGSRVIEHMPVAVIPSASILGAVRARRPAARRRVCMAYGMGESCDVYFREQADLVGGLPWKRCSVFPERTSKADLLAAMKDYPVIHFACHGSLPAAISDPLAASQIELFPPQVLTAGDVLRCGHVPAELVFLNACQSGRFRMSARSEPDGFWRAFLQAGAASIVATLALIDPDAASALALDFYQHWLGGSSKGKALQKAQCAMIERAAPMEHWGLHILVGDAA